MKTEKITLNDLEKILENYKYLDIQIEHIEFKISKLLEKEIIDISSDINNEIDNLNTLIDKKYKEKEIINNVFLELSKSEKRIIELIYFSFEKLTIKEIISITNISRATIYRKKDKALSKILTKLEKNSENYKYLYTCFSTKKETNKEDKIMKNEDFYKRIEINKTENILKRYKCINLWIGFKESDIALIKEMSYMYYPEKMKEIKKKKGEKQILEQEKNIIDNSLLSLNDLEKEIIRLMYFSIRKPLYKEIADKLNISRATFYRTRKKALNKLANALFN